MVDVNLICHHSSVVI